MSKLFDRLYGQLSAIEVLSVTREGPALNARGELLLKYLRARRRRAS